jgi:lipopolysaccharide transport system ATP-binding protein
MPVIEVSHLTKAYRLGALQGFKQALINTGARLVGKKPAERPLFRALDDVSFSIDQGEVVGIIGHNGAGKSTLLKMLAGISTPTSGKVKVDGRIAPLIEVGAGFVPDFTGRENVYLNGAIMGLTRKQINRRFDEIVDFAEMAEFIDTPVKRYSSGMQVKLAFAVATSIESEILIVDEVLAVGDLAFQRKCFDRMEDLIKREGRTVLVVSHNIRQIERLSSRALMLDHGRIMANGSPKTVCERFFRESNEKIAAQAADQYKSGRNIQSTGEVELRSLTLLDRNGVSSTQFESGGLMIIRGDFESKVDLPQVEIMYGFHTTDMVYIATMGTAHLADNALITTGRNTIECVVPNVPLVPGTYVIRVGVLDRNRRQLFYGESLHVFTVLPKDIPVTKMSALGLVYIPARWRFNDASSHPDQIDRNSGQIEKQS